MAFWLLWFKELIILDDSVGEIEGLIASFNLGWLTIPKGFGFPGIAFCKVQ